MKLHITIYKSTGKYYTDTVVECSENIPLWDDRFRAFIKKHLPVSQSSGGYIVVQDVAGESGFHNCLLTYDELMNY